jgi:putative membrane protein
MSTLASRSALTLAVLGALALVGCDRRDDPTPPKAPPAATAPADPVSPAGRATTTAPADPSITPPADRATAARSASGTASEGDRRFVEQAAASGRAEVEIAQHTMDKAASAEVKRVAEHLHKDHSQANEELMRIAASKGITLPTGLAGEKRAEVDKLRSLSGAEFDRTVLDKLAQSHRESIKLFERQAADGADPALKAFAAKTLPTLREHLKMVEGTRSAATDSGPQAAAKR